MVSCETLHRTTLASESQLQQPWCCVYRACNHHVLPPECRCLGPGHPELAFLSLLFSPLRAENAFFLWVSTDICGLCPSSGLYFKLCWSQIVTSFCWAVFVAPPVMKTTIKNNPKRKASSLVFVQLVPWPIISL